MTEGGHLRQVLHPVSDVDTAVAFYQAALGFPAKFTDANRYAALRTGEVTLALTGPDEDITGGIAAASVKVPDLATAISAFTRAGGSLVRGPEEGPHETRAVVRDPWNNTIVLYAPR
ncbi:VOC family protein [Amycolatopsis thermoflava]|uniref:VOC family protein n=1 Tax=Amycolatopsis TaxID=1813 RepID=UPI0033ACF9D2